MAEEKKGQFPSSLKEARQHGSFSFPCAFYQAVPETNPPGFPFTVKHHWHEPVEIIYLEQDSYQVDINMTLTHLKSPCFCFINSGELHMHLPPILNSIRNRLSSFLPICSHSPLRIRHRNSFCSHYRNINFPFHLFLDLITRPFRGSTAGIFPDPLNLFPRKPELSGSVYNPKVPFHNCGSRQHF